MAESSRNKILRKAKSVKDGLPMMFRSKSEDKFDPEVLNFEARSGWHPVVLKPGDRHEPGQNAVETLPSGSAPPGGFISRRDGGWFVPEDRSTISTLPSLNQVQLGSADHYLTVPTPPSSRPFFKRSPSSTSSSATTLSSPGFRQASPTSDGSSPRLLPPSPSFNPHSPTSSQGAAYPTYTPLEDTHKYEHKHKREHKHERRWPQVRKYDERTEQSQFDGGQHERETRNGSQPQWTPPDPNLGKVAESSSNQVYNNDDETAVQPSRAAAGMLERRHATKFKRRNNHLQPSSSAAAGETDSAAEMSERDASHPSRSMLQRTLLGESASRPEVSRRSEERSKTPPQRRPLPPVPHQSPRKSLRSHASSTYPATVSSHNARPSTDTMRRSVYTLDSYDTHESGSVPQDVVAGQRVPLRFVPPHSQNHSVTLSSLGRSHHALMGRRARKIYGLTRI